MSGLNMTGNENIYRNAHRRHRRTNVRRRRRVVSYVDLYSVPIPLVARDRLEWPGREIVRHPAATGPYADG